MGDIALCDHQGAVSLIHAALGGCSFSNLHEPENLRTAQEREASSSVLCNPPTLLHPPASAQGFPSESTQSLCSRLAYTVQGSAAHHPVQTSASRSSG